MKYSILYIICLLITSTAIGQMRYLDKSYNQVKSIAAKYNVEPVRIDNDVKCLFFTDTENSMEFQMCFNKITDRCDLVIVTPLDNLTEKALFILLDRDWTSINNKTWNGNYDGFKILVKAIPEKNNELNSFYYSIIY